MMAKPGRPKKPKPQQPRFARATVKIPRNLTTAQRRHLREIAAGASEQTLVDEYAAALQLRDECAALIKKEGATVKTERGAMKLHPASQMLKDCNQQMLRLRALIDKTRGERPPVAGGHDDSYEGMVQKALRGDYDKGVMLLIDEFDDSPENCGWRKDPRVVRHREEVFARRQQRVQ